MSDLQGTTEKVRFNAGARERRWWLVTFFFMRIYTVLCSKGSLVRYKIKLKISTK